MRNRRLPGFAGLLSGLLLASVLSLNAQSASHPTDIRWYHALGGLGVLAAASPLDLPIRNEIQSHRGEGKDQLASIVRHMGQPEVYATVSLGTLGAGLL